MAHHGRPCERDVSHEVEDLVPYELVGVPQALLVKDLGVSHDHGVAEGASLGKPVCPEHLDVAQKPEGPGAGDLFFEDLTGKEPREGLLREEGVGEVYGVVYGESPCLRGQEHYVLVAPGDLYGPLYHEILPGLMQFSEPRALEHLYELLGAPVEHRDLGARELYRSVIYAEAVKGRQQMVDGGDTRPACTEGCGVVGVNDVRALGPYSGGAGGIGPYEGYSRGGARGGYPDLYVAPRVEADAGEDDLISKSLLHHHH